MPDLATQLLTKTFPGGAQALRGVSLQAADRRLTAVVGPSGCGKTTLLRIIAGLDRATSGRVLIDGQPIDNLPPHRRGVGMVFQQPALYPYLSVRANLTHGLKKLGVTAADAGARAESAAALLGLGPLLDRRPDQLSGGEAQRVALGRAIARRPQLLLLDEPLSSLDAALRGQLRGELRRVHAESGATTLFVTHDQSEALSLADQLVVMADGQLQQAGPPLDVYCAPANRFVARFLGSPGMNLWEGAASGGRFRSADGGLDAPAPEGVEGRVVLGVRPEHLLLGGDRGEPLGASAIAAIEPLGADALARLTVGVARVPLPTSLTAGERAPLRAERSNLHYFSADPQGDRLGDR